VRFAYCDPPYPGCAHYYLRENPNAQEVNHALLIGSLCEDYPDGWALSTHANALRDLLPLCPPDVRVAAWCKPFATWKLGGRGTSVPYTWEPVIVRGGGKRKRTKRLGVVCRDFVLASPPLRQRVPGEKPPAFSWWVFSMLGAEPGDEMVDLFPGSGAVGEAWRAWCGDWDTTGTLFAAEAAEPPPVRCVFDSQHSPDRGPCPECGWIPPNPSAAGQGGDRRSA
jgi:hypothetical protein